MRYIKSIVGLAILAFTPISLAGINFTAAPPSLVSAQTSTGLVTTSYAITPVTNVKPPAIKLLGDFFVSFPSNGDLLSWQIDRPIAASSFGPFAVKITNTGFIDASSALLGGGYLRAEIFNTVSGLQVPGTIAQVNFSYSGPHTNFSSSDIQPVLLYTYAIGDVLRMEYSAQGNAFPGVVQVNFPAEVEIIPVPEPTGVLIFAAAIGLLGSRRRSNKIAL